MIAKLLKLRRPKEPSSKYGDLHGLADATLSENCASSSRSSTWRQILTQSLRENCLAPSDEAILQAFDLFKEKLYAPSAERERQLVGLHADIAAQFSTLQAAAPDLIERALARHPYEFSHVIESNRRPSR